MRESPRWLISRNRRDEAIRNLSYLRKLESTDLYLMEEVLAIDIQIQHDFTAVGPGFWGPFKQLFTRSALFKRLLICTSLFMWQNGTGINGELASAVAWVLGAEAEPSLFPAINYYSPTVFRSLGLTGNNTALLTTGEWVG